MTGDLPPQTDEGKVLHSAMKIDGRSVRQVAPLAGITEARWRQIVKGSMSANGRVTEVIAPAATLARMAYVLDVTPKALVKAGRGDAAEILEHLLSQPQRGGAPVALPVPDQIAPAADEIDLIYASRTMTPKQKLEAIRKVLQLRAQIEATMPGGNEDNGEAETAQPESQDAC